jgi:hypothetical protein
VPLLAVTLTGGRAYLGMRTACRAFGPPGLLGLS